MDDKINTVNEIERVEEMDYSNLTKAQRKKLKKEKREQERELARADIQKKQRVKKIRNYTIVLLIIIAIAGFIYWRLTPPKDAPIIEITPSSYDFGTVSQAEGVVSTLMTIKNNGIKDLILNNIDTSCGCTSASVISDGQEGPRFSMVGHGTNPKDWKQVISSGESVQLKVYYDPNVHQDLRGKVVRTVNIYSNDLRSPKKGIRISANQI